jgi:hypothetical protein
MRRQTAADRELLQTRRAHNQLIGERRFPRRIDAVNGDANRMRKLDLRNPPRQFPNQIASWHFVSFFNARGAPPPLGRAPALEEAFRLSSFPGYFSAYEKLNGSKLPQASEWKRYFER